MYYLILARSALRHLWHEGCGRVADTARGEVTHSSPTLNGLLLLRGRHQAVR